MNTTAHEDSFISAWSKAKFPDENRAFVKSICDEIGIVGFEYKPRSYSYIAATRRDGTGELRIHWGCTTGFTEAEARHFGAGADEVRISSTRKKTWLVSHPPCSLSQRRLQMSCATISWSFPSPFAIPISTCLVHQTVR